MSVVRILPHDAEGLVDAYARTASLLADALGELGSLVSEANGLLASPSYSAQSAVEDLGEVAEGCSRAQDDLAWRVEWIRTHDHLDVPDGTRNLFDLIAQAEDEADMFGHDLNDLDIPALTPLQQAELALGQIRTVLDTAKFDAEHGGIGTTVADGIWSTEDLEVIIENEHGYYTPSQVAHAQIVLAMATSSPEARDYLGIKDSDDGWGWDDIGHVTLDVLGMVPVVGNAADGINASWYAAEGEWLDAALSSMALIPGIGQAVTLAKANVKAALRHVPFNSFDEALVAVREFLQRIGVWPSGRVAQSPGINAADGPRLVAALRLEEATSAFDTAGHLAPETIARSRIILDGDRLSNPSVIQALTSDGSVIGDWGKYSTRSIDSPSGPFQVHFYRNDVTGSVNYDFDYKAIFNSRSPS